MIFKENRSIRIRVSALIVENGEILLIAHKKGNKVYWLTPGGGVDYGETLPAALQRELKEELGVEIEVGDIAFICDTIEPSHKRHILHVFFHCSTCSRDYSIGAEKRLFSYNFFSASGLSDIILFPSVTDEIREYLEAGSIRENYFQKKWMPL